MKNIKERIKDKFGYNISELPTYVDAQSADIYADLLYGAGLTSRINVLESVKGSQTIKLLNSNMALQSGDSCSTTESGTIVFDGKDISTKRLMVNTSLCNDSLEDTWAQLLLSIGANRQDRDLPLQDVLTAYIVKQTKAKNQDIMFNGDTASATPDLAHYDGFIKLWEAAGSGVIDANSLATSVTNTNAFDLAMEVYNEIPTVLFDNGANVELICGRTFANKILAQIYNDKDYNALIDVTEEGSEMSFILPTTNIRVRTYPQLNTSANVNKLFAVPYDYCFFGTDLESDLDGLSVKYLEESEKIRVRNLFRSGVQFVYGEYFVRLTLS